MYLTADAVLRAINILKRDVHPFLGITFLACKRLGLSVGVMDNVSIDAITRSHMDDHHQIDRRSTYYFQPFKSAAWWVTRKYPSAGLQTINTQTFATVFLHERTQRGWGFQYNYVENMIYTLQERNYSSDVAADALAVWLLKDRDIGNIDNFEELVELFFHEYDITYEERERLFSRRAMKQGLLDFSAFSDSPLQMTSVIGDLPRPPDAEAEFGSTIVSMRLIHAGPSRDMNIDFGQRLTMITGDNGLGKSFLLDFAWWSATGLWPRQEIIPHAPESDVFPQVVYRLSSRSGRLLTFTEQFDRKKFSWTRSRASMTVEALAIFSRADGSFAISDPLRDKFNKRGTSSGTLSADDVWNGRFGVIEGLIRDWTRWQAASDRKIFDQFSAVLRRLSPEDLGLLRPGRAVRLPGDPREIPTIEHRYGTVPVTQASSGVQRVLLLAYLIIWSWQEHQLAAEGLGRPALHRMMVVVDELEAHLHPKWQRIVLPALMNVGDLLSSDLAIQTIAATHSPMILASMEATFDESTDTLYHLYGSGSEVELEEIPFVKYGDASGWLTSPLFGLRHARSREAEMAIEAAKRLQIDEMPDPEQVAAVSDLLRMHLAPDDKFWSRWLYFAELHGVIL